MTETTLLAQRNSNGNIKCITMNLDGDTIERAWGILNGKAQVRTNEYGYKNKGRANESTPVMTARAAYEKIIKTKTDEGYLVVDSFNNIPETTLDKDVMDLDNLPKQFCCSKPTAKISEKALGKLITSGNAFFQLKYNGLCHYILVDSNQEIKIYTRRIEDHTVKYPAIVKDVKELNLPAKTLLITEFVIDPELNIPHMEAFRIMQTISKANVSGGKPKKDLSKSNARQDVANGGHRVRTAVFGVLYYNGKKVWDQTGADNLHMLNSYIPTIHADNALFVPDQVFLKTAKEAINFARKMKALYEGLVAWDLSKSMEITFNGKPKRRAAFKVKPTAEMDVIAFGYNLKKNQAKEEIGSLKIGLYNADGSIFDMGDCGSGLKPLNGDRDINNWTFPCVIEVEYDQIFPTGKLQFPVYSKKHEDKLPGDSEFIRKVAA